jgi:hypothetical protein
MSANRVYSLPELKEPEKKSSWDDLPKEAPIVLRDTELEKSQKRTALIKAAMSPPGALQLPPLLEAARLKYGIPDGAFRSQASFDRIYVFPLDLFEGEETYGGSCILKANVTKMKDTQEGNRGVLISAGLTASDRLASHGIELGHIVSTNKNVPFARRCERLQDFDMFYLVMRDGDLAGSETLAEELRAGTKQITDVGGDDGYNHVIGGVKKQSVYVNDTW